MKIHSFGGGGGSIDIPLKVDEGGTGLEEIPIHGILIGGDETELAVIEADDSDIRKALRILSVAGEVTAPVWEVDIPGGTKDNLVKIDDDGNVIDSGLSADDFLATPITSTQYHIPSFDDVGNLEDSGVSIENVLVKDPAMTQNAVAIYDSEGGLADSEININDIAILPASPTEDSIVVFDDEGGIKDSGKKAEDFLTKLENDTSPKLGGNLDADGKNIINVGNIELLRNSVPSIEFRDADCVDNKVNAEIYAEATKLNSNAENVDMYFRQMIDGVLSVFLHADADGDLDFYYRNLKTSGFLKDHVHSVKIADIRTVLIEKHSVVEDTIITIPKGYCLEYIVFDEILGNSAVLDLGTTIGQSDIFKNKIITALETTTIKIFRTFSMSNDINIYLNANDTESNWNDASIDVYCITKRLL